MKQFASQIGLQPDKLEKLIALGLLSGYIVGNGSGRRYRIPEGSDLEAVRTISGSQAVLSLVERVIERNGSMVERCQRDVARLDTDNKELRTDIKAERKDRAEERKAWSDERNALVAKHDRELKTAIENRDVDRKTWSDERNALVAKYERERLEELARERKEHIEELARERKEHTEELARERKERSDEKTMAVAERDRERAAFATERTAMAIERDKERAERLQLTEKIDAQYRQIQQLNKQCADRIIIPKEGQRTLMQYIRDSVLSGETRLSKWLAFITSAMRTWF